MCIQRGSALLPPRPSEASFGNSLVDTQGKPGRRQKDGGGKNRRLITGWYDTIITTRKKKAFVDFDPEGTTPPRSVHSMTKENSFYLRTISARANAKKQHLSMYYWYVCFFCSRFFSHTFKLPFPRPSVVSRSRAHSPHLPSMTYLP